MSDETELKDVQHAELEVESAEIDISGMIAKKKKRYRARQRKRRQRDHEKKGIPSGAEARLVAEWKQNLDAVEADPVKAEALRDRLFSFDYIRSQMRAVIDRINRGVHAEASGAGRFYDVVAMDVVYHARQIGLTPFNPPFLILQEITSRPAPLQQAIADKYMNDESFRYRMTYGLNCDVLSNLEFYSFFEAWFRWYMGNRDDASYDFEWNDADRVYSEFEIPQQFIEGVFGKSTKSIWPRIDRRRRGLPEENRR